MTDKAVLAEELRRLAAEAARPGQHSGRPPPRDLGDIGIRIRHDGSWFYQGSPITRASLVRLFASVLRREADGAYWMVTPAERARVTVEEMPFMAVELTAAGAGLQQILSFRTNVDEIVTADSEHPLTIVPDSGGGGGPRPYILVRDGLEAKLARPVFYQLVDLGREAEVDGVRRFGVWSSNIFFPLGETA
jgi:hypothetical protein